jgi:hypothetical protein
MPVMNQPSHVSPIRTSAGLARLLLVLAGALGAACGEETPEPGLLVIDRDAFDFGQLHVGEVSAEHTFTVRNAGPDALANLRVRLLPSDTFAVVGTTCAGWLEPSEACTVTATFTPPQAGAAQGDLIVEADRADVSAALAGVGAATVRVTNNLAASALVESEPAGIRCGSACEATFTVPEIVLSATGAGIAVWSGACDGITPAGACVLALRGDVTVALEDLLGLQWSFEGVEVRGLATDAQGNVIGVSTVSPLLFKLSPAGELAWQRDDLGGGHTLAVDAQGNIGFAAYNGVLVKLDGAGDVTWSLSAEQTGFTEIFGLAFDPSGALYAAGFQGPSEAAVARLVKFDASGGVLWSRTHAPALMNFAMELVVDGSGNALILGYASLTTDNDHDVKFMRKYDANGDLLWSNEDHPSRPVVDAAGSLFVAGVGTIRKYAPDGTLVWEVFPRDGGTVSDLAVTPAGDVIAAGTRYTDSAPAGMWAAAFDGADGTQRRPFMDPDVVEFYGHVTVDGNGDVLLGNQVEGSGLRKYDGGLFDLLAE